MFKLRVYYEDTDAGGIVYYANYLKYLERARTNILLNKGISNNFLKEKFDILLIVKSCSIDFIKPAYLEDELFVETNIDKFSKVQIFMSQNIIKNKEIILKAIIRIAFINKKGKISRIPEKLLSIFS